MYFSHLGVFLISVKPMTTENTENKTAPKICKITVVLERADYIANSSGDKIRAEIEEKCECVCVCVGGGGGHHFET